jgi:hypothetical protein
MENARAFISDRTILEMHLSGLLAFYQLDVEVESAVKEYIAFEQHLFAVKANHISDIKRKIAFVNKKLAEKKLQESLPPRLYLKVMSRN